MNLKKWGLDLTDLFLPGDEIVVAAKIKYVGGNFLVVNFANDPGNDVIVLKNQSIKFQMAESHMKIIDNFTKNQTRCDKIIYGGFVYPYDEVTKEIKSYSWLQTFLTDEITFEK